MPKWMVNILPAGLGGGGVCYEFFSVRKGDSCLLTDVIMSLCKKKNTVPWKRISVH